jgi:hypothetical protein
MRNLCHDNWLHKDKAAFALVSNVLKEFIMDNLWLRLFVSQVMAKHRKNIKQVLESIGYLTRTMFLCEQDIRT